MRSTSLGSGPRFSAAARRKLYWTATSPSAIAFARRLVNTTDRVFTLATAEGRIADLIRTRLVPVLFPAAAKFEALREWMFRMVSQVTINYRHSPLSAGSAGDLHGGDRLPWVPIEDTDNYRPLAAATWQAHVYGVASPELVGWCQRYGLPLQVFAWRPHYGEAGFARDALYLLRPDTYIALAEKSASPDPLRRYFADRGLRL